MIRRIAPALVLSVLLIGCGGDDDAVDGGANGDTGVSFDAPVVADARIGPDAPPPDAFVPPPDAGPCNMLSNAAPQIATELINAAAIPHSGGTIVDGTYHLTRAVIYNPQAPQPNPNVGPAKSTAVISGTTMELIALSGGMDVATTSTFVTGSPSDITFTQSCPSMNELGWDWYTASGTTLVLHNKVSPSSDAVRVNTYTRQ